MPMDETRAIKAVAAVPPQHVRESERVERGLTTPAALPTIVSGGWGAGGAVARYAAVWPAAVHRPANGHR